MDKKQIIDIDAEFDGFELDEAAISRATGFAKRSQNPEWHKNKTEAIRNAMQRPEVKENHRKAQQEKCADPEYRKRIAETNRKTAQTEEWKEANVKAIKDRETSGWREKNYEKNIKMTQTSKWKEAQAAAARRYSESGKALENNRKIIEQRKQDPEYFIKLKEGIANRTQDPEWQRKNNEAAKRRRKSIVTPDGIFPYATKAFEFYAQLRGINVSSAEGWLKKMRDTKPKEFYTISQEEYIMLTGKEI